MVAQAFSPEARAHRAWQAGQQLYRRGRWMEAAERFRFAQRLQPRDPLYSMMLAQAFLRMEQIEPALEAVTSATELDPENATVLHVRAQCLRLAKRYAELVQFVSALPEQHQSSGLLKLLGEAQSHLGLEQEAVQTWLRALVHNMTDAQLYLRLGYALHGISLKREAAECLRTALALGGVKSGPIIYDLLHLFEREACDWGQGRQPLNAMREAVCALGNDAAEMVNPFAFAVLCDDARVNLKASRAYANYIENATAVLPPRAPVRRDRIRVGYVSADFFNHATSILMAELLESHDRSRFEVFLYSHGRPDGSPMEARIRSSSEHVVEQQDDTLVEMTRRIREDEIDILVDLKGYTKDSRFQLFAARPAPVQVSYLGFPGSSGSAFIDYIVGDSWVTPLEHADHYSEKIAQMPGCYQCNDSRRPLPQTARRSDHGLPDDAVVLCGFNQPYKISSEVFDVWCRILKQVPGAVLWLLEWGDQAPEALKREAVQRGVDVSRLVFAPVLRSGPHLDRMACADLFLDTWPCNGHTTASDALWAGLPIVTLSGETFASRVAGSLLRSIGMSELVCSSVAEYEASVLELLGQPGRLESLRQRVRDARTSAELFSGRRAAQGLENLYEQMWELALLGESPRHLCAA